MGKGRRLREQRNRGERKIKGERWSEIPDGMMLVIPKFEAVNRGAAPTLVPVHWKERGHKQAIPKRLAHLPALMAPKMNQFQGMFDRLVKQNTHMPSDL